MLTGFPWNTFGYALTAPLALAQSASLVGIWGLTFIAVAVFASPACSPTTAPKRRWPWLPLVLGVVVLAGARRLSAPCGSRASRPRFVDGVQLRIMQPNLQQDEKFNYAAKQQVMDRYIALSDRATGPQSPACATSPI